MIILRGQVLGFGKLRNRALEFQSGLNLIFAANEGGKSTLQRFLIALLYGQLRSDLKIQRRLDPWVEQYKPWRGQDYGGILWCRLADGREVEIHRSFGKDETRVEIRSSSGEDITRLYEQQRNGEVLFARSHFGMPKELFESIGVIRENRVAEIHGYESVRDRIANLAQSGDEELSTRQSLEKIQEAIDSIGSERAPTRPYKQAMDLVQTLREEQKALQDRQVQFQSWVEDRNRVAGEVSGLERELQKIQAVLLSSRKREMAGRIQALEEIETELGCIRSTIETLGARDNFPSGHLEELNQLAGARVTSAKHLGEIRSEREAAFAKLSEAEEKKRELAAYAPFAKGNDAEKITEWFVSYLSISLQKDGLQKTISRLNGEAAVLEKRLSELSPALLDPQEDWERLAREAAEDEQIASEHSTAVIGRIAIEKANMTAAARARRSRRNSAVLLAVFAVVISGARLAGVEILPNWVYFLTGGLALLAFIMVRASSKSAKAEMDGKSMLRNLETELGSIQAEGRKKRKAFDEGMRNSGFDNLEKFLDAAKRTEQDRQKLAELRSRVVEAEQLREKLQGQSEDLYQQLKDGLAKAGLSCSPGNLKFQIDLLRANLRRFRELDMRCVALGQNAASLRSKDEELTLEYDRVCSRIQLLLDESKVESPEQYREECSKRQKLLELREKEASRAREFSRLADGSTIEQWKEKLEELMGREEPQCAAEPAGSAADVQQSLPYLPTIAEAEEQEKRVRSLLSTAREDLARAVERVKQAFESFRPAFEIEEDLAVAERKFAELENNRRALEIALETLGKLSRQQQEVLAPQLNAAVEQRFLRLCAGRYEEVKIDPDFQIWVREADTGELRLADHLSRGTQDQLYFSVRFGIMDLISNPEEPCPGFLDEPFAAYDQARLREAFEVLAAEAERRQLILFTCREDLLQLSEKHRANIIFLGAEEESGRKPESGIVATSAVKAL